MAVKHQPWLGRGRAGAQRGWCEEEEGDEGASGWRGKVGAELHCSSPQPGDHNQSWESRGCPGNRSGSALGLFPVMPHGWSSLGPLSVLSLARPVPGCPQLPHSWAWPFLSPAAALLMVPFPQCLSQISKWCGLCWVLAWGPWGLSKSPPPMHGLCCCQCCISLAGSVHCPSLVSLKNNAAGVTLPWEKPNPHAWPSSTVGDGLGKNKM